MIGALWTGISGLSSHQKALDNESNNIANVNTVGYKSSRISFADQMYQSKIGKGSIVQDAEKLYVQGNTKITGVEYDMMLEGDGFFTVVNKNTLGTAESFYTRAGNFRMGDNGTLQDAGGNEVQGWIMAPIDTSTDVTSTNPNTSVFTNIYNKMLGSKIIRHGTYVETVTAKATDYNLTAKSDSTTVFSGDGAKSKSSKVADIENAIKDYNNWLQKLKEEPDASSANSLAQVSQIDFKSGTDSIIGKDGDRIYAVIDGQTVSTNFIVTSSTPVFRQKLWDSLKPAERTAEGLIYDPAMLNTDPNYQKMIASFDRAAGKIETYKALADLISNRFPVEATMAIDAAEIGTFNTNTAYKSSTNYKDMLKGIIQIKSLIPGQEFKITEVAEQSGTKIAQGNYQSTAIATKGSGIAAVQTSKDALSKLISGKQQDVYTPADLNLSKSPVFQYSIIIYDKELGVNIPIPNDNAKPPVAVPLFIDATDSNGNFTVDEFVNKFNQSGSSTNPPLTNHIIARNVNGNLVIETLDSNFDVEFTGSMNQLPSMQINLNEIIDNANYTFNIQNGADLVNLSLSDTTYTPFIPTSSLNTTISQSQIYDTLKDKITNYNSTNPTDRLYISSLNNGNFNIYTQNENITFSGSTIGLIDDRPYVNSIAGVAGTLTTLDATKISISPSLIQTSTEAGLVGNTGVVRVNFAWDEDLDIDPIIIDPNGDGMGYHSIGGDSIPNTTSTGGIWDVDDRGNGYGLVDNPNQENFYWATSAPTGDYNFYIRNYSNSWPTGNPIDIAVTIKTGADIEVRNLVIPVSTQDIGPFIFNYDGSVSSAPTTPATSIPTTSPYKFTIKDSTDNIVLADIIYSATSSDPATFYAGLLNEIRNTTAYQNGLITATSDATGVNILNHNLVFSSSDNTIVSNTTQGLDGVAKEIKYTIDDGDELNKSKSLFKLTINNQEFVYKTDDTPTSQEVRDYFNSIIQSHTTLNNLVEISGTGDEIIIKNKDTINSGFQDFTASFQNFSLTEQNDGYETIKSSISPITPIEANKDYSGREGAGAEFLEIVTKVDQMASKGSIQLRLDTLNISDSPFGEFSVDNTGLITMKQDGAEFAIGQVAIARFNNNRGLNPEGNNLYGKTTQSGDPIYNINNNKTAEVRGKALELSNADLSESLVNLMIFQRAFEANAKSITTSDELLNTLINLKR